MGLMDLLTGNLRPPAECVIELDGEEIDDLYPGLIEATVEADRKEWTTATLVFETRRLEDGEWTVQDDDRVKPWVTVKITAVFGDDREEVMRGYIREVRAEYPSDRGSARVTVTCQDDSLLLDRRHVDQRWGEDAPTTDGQIAGAIAARHGLGLTEPPDEGMTVQDLNQNTTDQEFLSKRAEANSYEVIFREGQMHFGGMRLDADPQPTIMVYAGPDTHCIRFDLQDDGHKPDRIAYQVAAESGTESPVEEVTPDLPLLGNEPANSEGAGLDDFVWRPQRRGVSDDSQMRAIAQALANEQSMKIKAEGELDGSRYGHVLLTGLPVGVDGLGTRHNGVYYVDAATHRFDADGYRVDFRLLRNAYGDNLPESGHPLEGII
jgi:phage protein D